MKAFNNDEKITLFEEQKKQRRAKARPQAEVFAAIDERLMIMAKVQTAEETAPHLTRICELLDELKRSLASSKTTPEAPAE